VQRSKKITKSIPLAEMLLLPIQSNLPEEILIGSNLAETFSNLTFNLASGEKVILVSINYILQALSGENT
jgi:hypothetical protein